MQILMVKATAMFYTTSRGVHLYLISIKWCLWLLDVAGKDIICNER